MPRTPIATRLRNIFLLVDEAERRGISLTQAQNEHRWLSTRREFLRASAVAIPALFLPPVNAATAPRVVVVGAGLAGLTCAFQLKQAGLVAEVYEAADRVGGRCSTRRSDFAENQIVEHGGELIDQSHKAIRQLAQSLGLKLDNLLQAEKNGAEEFYFFDGLPYAADDAINDLKSIWQQIHSDLSAASYPTLYNHYTLRGRELDNMSVLGWIDRYVPGGTSSRLGQLLDIAYNIEYGAESSDQSSLNLLYLLGYLGPGQLRIFGPSNEKYHVRGGNDQIPARMAAALDSQVRLGYALRAIRLMRDGRYRLTFRYGNRFVDVSADHVVLTLPFSILRSSVDYSAAGFCILKCMAIEELGMGTNSKLHVQFNDRHWENLGCNGATYADTGYQSTWDVTRAQPGKSGILVDYTGGLVGDSFAKGTPRGRAAQFLSQIEPVLPGLKDKWNGRATIDYWHGDPFTKGSYSYWKVGQYTKFAGIEGEPEAACHFAGEHTSIDSQGYLNGAVESGERAASEVLAAYK
jgi:monoamine oxidase